VNGVPLNVPPLGIVVVLPLTVTVMDGGLAFVLKTIVSAALVTLTAVGTGVMAGPVGTGRGKLGGHDVGCHRRPGCPG